MLKLTAHETHQVSVVTRFWQAESPVKLCLRSWGLQVNKVVNVFMNNNLHQIKEKYLRSENFNYP